MKTCYDVIVLGGGISGLTSAIAFARIGKKVCIVERDIKLGKKFLITGNGRCNLSNISINSNKYNTQKVQEIFNHVSKEQVKEFLDSLAIETYSDDEGRIYPISNSAECVRQCFVKEIERLGITIVTGEVLSILKNELFNINTTNSILYAKKCVVALGGSFNSSIFSNISLKLEDTKTTLVGYKCKNYDKSLSGIRQDCKVTIMTKNEVFEETGQVQFKDDGVSGIVILNASVFAEKNYCENFHIKLDLMPQLSDLKLKEILMKRIKNNSYLSITDLFVSLMPYKLSQIVLKLCKLDKNKSISTLTSKQIDELIEQIKNFNLIAIEKYENPQVYYGGVHLNNLNNLESTCKGLYFIGETACVYGYCGGYNIHWAISSGLYVAKMN